jgi:hypothetical protein
MSTDVTIENSCPPLPRPRFLAIPIVALILVLPEPACVSPDARQESITRRQSALGPSSLGRATKVAAGGSHSCALLSTGAVVCWGLGQYGQLGNGSLVSSAQPVAVSGLSDAVALTAGNLHTCAVRRTGEVVCWGRGDGGVLGNGILTDASVSVFVTVSGLSDAVSVAAGLIHTCALRRTGEVACWGINNTGQLGYGRDPDEGADSAVPVPVTGLSDAVSITADYLHTCALRATGEVVCWGYGYEGQLGNGSITSYAKVPDAVLSLFRHCVRGSRRTSHMRRSQDRPSRLLGPGRQRPNRKRELGFLAGAPCCVWPLRRRDRRSRREPYVRRPRDRGSRLLGRWRRRRARICELGFVLRARRCHGCFRRHVRRGWSCAHMRRSRDRRGCLLGIQHRWPTWEREYGRLSRARWCHRSF